MSIGGATKLVGILGWPVSQSRSPRLHNFWFARHGIDAAYVPLPVAPADFPDAVRVLARLGFVGANVTIPHKEAAVAVADEADEAARAAGAANTLVFRDGRIRGLNTDAAGFVDSVAAALGGFDFAARPALVLGSGGGARGVVYGLVREGARDIRLAARNAEAARRLAADFAGRVKVLAWDGGRAVPGLAGAGLVVNATPLGMTGKPPLAVDLAGLAPDAAVVDIVYTPLETRFLSAARAAGHRTVGGLGMLLHQARAAFRAWFGVDPAVTDELARHVADGIPPHD
jgi:shikimate dehydrogenase